MFQYAASLYAGKLWRQPVGCVALGHREGGRHPRPFLLDCFAIPQSVPQASWLVSKACGQPQRRRPLKRMLRRLLGINLIEERSAYRTDPLFAAPPVASRALFHGFWQCRSYVDAVAPELRANLRFKAPPAGRNAAMLAQIEAGPQAVAVHIRRGDYLNIAGGGIVLGLDYYRAAMAYVAGAVTQAHFFVFSDDPAWARDNLSARYPSSFISGNDEAQAHEDLRLLSACRHHIIANSSFSWWGAWLSRDPGKLVIMPKLWMGGMPTPAELVEPGWQTMR